MAQRDEEFQTLMKEAMTGSEAAARRLFEQYEPVLLQAIRRKLNKKLRPKFDSVDFAQDVWKSFFAQPAEKRVFDNPQHLLAFLTALAENKVAQSTRQRFDVAKYDVRRELPLDDSKIMQKDHLVGEEPTPSFVAMTQEEWSAFVHRQPLVYQRIFVMLREGKTHVQIAASLDIHVRTVERVVAKAISELRI